MPRLNIDELSKDHPLRSEPMKPWPYAVVVGYRQQARKIVKRRTVYVRSIGPAAAELDAVMYCRNLAMPLYDETGRKLMPSRALSVRPLDKGDCINSTAC